MKSINPSKISVLTDRRGMARGVPVRVFGGNKKNGILAIGGIALVAGAMFAWGGDIADWVGSKAKGAASSVGLVDAPAEDAEGAAPIIVDTRAGVAATAYFNAFDRSANTETEIYPTYVMFDELGNKLVNGANVNSTATVKGATLKSYIIGATYYGVEPVGLAITSEAPTFTIDGYTIASESSLAVKGFDSDENVLTADDNSTNTVDYSLDMNADDTEVVWIKLANEDPDSRFQVGAFCTFHKLNTTAVEDFSIVDANWEKMAEVPDELQDAVITYTNDAGTTATQTGYDKCYKPKAGVIVLDENMETPKIKATVETKATAPAANGAAAVGGLFIDIAHEDGKDGKVYFDIYKHDDDEAVTAVGLDETETSPQGLTSGLMIELQ